MRVSTHLDLDAIASVTYSAVFSDVCDAMGFRVQTAEPGILPMVTFDKPLVGWARTVQSVGVVEPPLRPYGREIDFIDSLSTGDVVVAQVSDPAAFWGELFSAAAIGRGARGTVVDGLVRDVSRVASVAYPLFARGTRPTDSLGRISIQSCDKPIDFAGVRVSPGDLVVADSDGVTFVPSRIAKEAIARAIEKVTTENRAKQMLLEGANLAQAWERFRVL